MDCVTNMDQVTKGMVTKDQGIVIEPQIEPQDIMPCWSVRVGSDGRDVTTILYIGNHNRVVPTVTREANPTNLQHFIPQKLKDQMYMYIRLNKVLTINTLWRGP